MRRTTFHGRRAVQIETDLIRVTITAEGGHIAEMLNKHMGINPLWIPPWPSLEPSQWSAESFDEYGTASEAPVVGSIMGHSLCLDQFGSPSADEELSGIRIHGEAGLLPWEFTATCDGVTTRCVIPNSHLACERVLSLHGRKMSVRETVENLDPYDRPIAWTQHVSLGPPFLERGKTQFYANTAMGCQFVDYAERTVEPVWNETPTGLREVLDKDLSASGFRSFLLSKDDADSCFVAWSPALETAIAYSWKRSDFPWMGVWDENCARQRKPWNGRTLARGMEFAVTPLPGTRREMLERGSLLDTPGYRWIPAKGRVSVAYEAIMVEAKSMPNSFAGCEDLARQVV